MNKCLQFLVVTIAFGLALSVNMKAYAFNGIGGHTVSGIDAQREREEAAALDAIKQDNQAKEAQNNSGNNQNTTQTQQTPKVVNAPAGILFIGDSRCVQMREAVGGGNCSWICKNGARYEWFASTGVPQADSIVGRGTKVVICLGVNDPGNIDNYAALTNAKAAEWTARGARVYYCTINPVWENPYTSEDQVLNFNAAMPGKLAGVRWVETHNALQSSGCRIVDGLHYDTNTYINLFNIIIRSI